MSENELINLIRKTNINKKIYNNINNLINILYNKKYLDKLESRKTKLEHIITNQNDRISEGLIENCNHFFVSIKFADHEHKIICPKCGLTNMYEEIGISGDSHEAKMNRMFLKERNIDIRIELGIFTNPLYVTRLYLRAIEQINSKDNNEIIRKMIELKKKDLEKTSIRKVLK